MSRADTLKQKFQRNIEYIFRQSKILSKKYPNYMVFDYIESWCHKIILHNGSISFDFEIGELVKIIEGSPNDKFLNNYYVCLVRTNNLIKTKYRDIPPNPAQSLRISLIQMKLMREGILEKQDIHKFLNELKKESDDNVRSKWYL